MGRRLSRHLYTSCSSSLISDKNKMLPLFALSPIWTRWISSLDIPCRVHLNREHVIPRSKMPRYITEAPHNIIGFPVRLNHRRSNLKYTDSDKPGVPVWPCETCREPRCPLMGKLNKDGFTPPTIYKPVIAASILRSMYNHPEIAEFVHQEVLDIGIAMNWANDGYENLPLSIKDIFKA